MIIIIVIDNSAHTSETLDSECYNCSSILEKWQWWWWWWLWRWGRWGRWY